MGKKLEYKSLKRYQAEKKAESVSLSITDSSKKKKKNMYIYIVCLMNVNACAHQNLNTLTLIQGSYFLEIIILIEHFGDLTFNRLLQCIH